MDTSLLMDKNSLRFQLENCQVLLQLNSDLLEKDRLLKEHILHRMGMMESALTDLEIQERKKAQTEYDSALDRANRILKGIKVLMADMLNPDAFPSDSEFQSLV